jgi:glutamate formiminotransferase
MHQVFEQVRLEAKKHGVKIAGSQLVGLVPRKALESAAAHYLEIEDFELDNVLENRLERLLSNEDWA